jgi:hypothetical protein
VPHKAADQSAVDAPDPELGAALPLWRTFIEKARALAPHAEILWKTYAGKTGKQCVIRGKERNLAYLKPQTASFLVSAALSDAAVATLGVSKLSKDLVAEVQSSPRHPEGTPARVRVDSAASLEQALALLRIKIADAGPVRTKPRHR